MNSQFDRNLSKIKANYVPLTPISFLARAAKIHPDKTAIIHGSRNYDYQEFFSRCRSLAAGLRHLGIGNKDVVSVIAANTPEMLELHYGVPMLGAVLNCLNTRLDANTIVHCLAHSDAKALVVDKEYSQTVKEALAKLERDIIVIGIDDSEYAEGELLGSLEYEALLQLSDGESFAYQLNDEWEPISLLYTSGTTGNPKGCVYHHRGAYLNALSNLVTFGLNAESVYLWTLPMFHCNGWTFTWAVSAAAATHVCLRKVEPAPVFQKIADHGVSHMCGAPIVLNMLNHAREDEKRTFLQTVQCAVGGAAPPSAVIEELGACGFEVTHLYGLTESFGPATVCEEKEEWHFLEQEQRSRLLSRQGVNMIGLEDSRVFDPDTMTEVPWDGTSLGEVMLRGNTVMAGYLGNPDATEKAFKDGWFHTGDLAVCHADGYVEIRDRSKDIIISGGENISSLEIEEVLYRHPEVLEAAVVAKTDKKWGEVPCAFVSVAEDAAITNEELISYCRGNLAGFKVPKVVIFSDLPKTSTGKIKKYALREAAESYVVHQRGITQ